MSINKPQDANPKNAVSFHYLTPVFEIEETIRIAKLYAKAHARAERGKPEGVKRRREWQIKFRDWLKL